jgi:peptidoglycan/LPS O-acetylase OafA/YrhL
VELFWTLSGFIFYWKYAASVYARRTTAEEFALRRFSRLYPLHFITLILVTILQALYLRTHQTTFIYGGYDVHSFLAQSAMASHWLASLPKSFNGPVWSVSAELMVYAGFFAWVRNVKPGVLSCLAMFVLCKSAGITGYYPAALSPYVLVCAQYFFLGGLMQQALGRASGFERPVFVLAASVCVGLMLSMRWGLANTESPNALQPLLASAVLATVCAEAWLPQGTLRRAHVLGDLTYSSYLLHFPVQLTFVLLIDAAGLGRTQFFDTPVGLLGYLGVTFGAAVLAFRYLERPAQRTLRALALPRSRLVEASAKDVAISSPASLE